MANGMNPDEHDVAPSEEQGANSDSELATEDLDPNFDGIATGSGERAGSSVEDEDPVLAELRAERDQIRDRHLRLAADFDNYRKRTEMDLRARWERAQGELVGKLLEPLDDLQRVAAWEPETTSVDAIVEGVDLVERKFLRVMEDVGVEMIDPVGERFDPNTMEAMMRVPAETEDDDDVVERVFQKGCSLKGQLVRPARVSVYKAE